MTMQITDEQVRAIVAKSILDALPQEQREKMLEKAIVAIITPPEKDKWNHYGQPKRSELETLFQVCAREQVRDIVRELVAKEPIQKRLREVVTKALTKAIDSDQLEGELSDAILRAFTVRDR